VVIVARAGAPLATRRDMAQAKKRSSPWKRPNPAKKHTKLSAKSKASARASAKRAGRKYPNLVDNMRAAARQKGTHSRRSAKT
jgi:hypothetical protein